MRTLSKGELFSLDRRAPLDPQVAQAIKRFNTKHRCAPADIRWNPGSYKDADATTQLAVDRSIPPMHLWLEIGE